jgi:hypothetical protein
MDHKDPPLPSGQQDRKEAILGVLESFEHPNIFKVQISRGWTEWYFPFWSEPPSAVY